MASNKNYKIVFNNEIKSKNNLQRAGQNVVGEEGSISDYYNKKFIKKKQIESIDEEDDEPDQEENKKVNNFVDQTRKNIKSDEAKVRKETVFSRENGNSNNLARKKS